MKFFHSTQTMSTVVRMVLEETGAKYTPFEVSFQRSVGLKELEAVNPLGAVPTIVTDKGEVLTQAPAILEMIADQHPGKKLLAPAGSMERLRTLAWVSYVSSDLRPCLVPLFGVEDMTTSEAARAEIKAWAHDRIKDHLEYVDQSLKGKTWVMGDAFTIADPFLFMVTTWIKYDVDTSKYTHLTAWRARVAARPTVHRVLEEEGMLEDI